MINFCLDIKNRAVVSGGALAHPRNLEVLLTLFQPEGGDYVHHITASTPGFENLTTALKNVEYVVIAWLVSSSTVNTRLLKIHMKKYWQAFIFQCKFLKV
jgi:hypothetical protein